MNISSVTDTGHLAEENLENLKPVPNGGSTPDAKEAGAS